MRRQLWWGAGSLVGILVAVTLWALWAGSRNHLQPAVVMNAGPAAPNGAPPTLPQSAPPIRPERKRHLPHPPTQNELAAEAKANPHVTPQSLLLFVAELSPRMEEAMQNEESARKLFPELENCIRDEKLRGALSTQAVCLNDAHQLARKHDSLAARYQRLANQAAPEVRRLSSAIPNAR